MQTKHGDATIFAEHRFDELKVVAHAGEEAGFEKAFTVLAGSDGVRDDAAADAHVSNTLLEHECADGDVERGRTVWRDMADGPGVDTAWTALEFADDLHGADLWRSGDRSAGEEGAEDIVVAKAGAQRAGDRRGHLQEGCVALDREDVIDA